MHALLTRRLLLAEYLGVWIPCSCLLVFLVRVSGGIATWEAIALLLPMAALFSLACLATWYTCRATPLRSSGVVRFFVTHFFAAILLSYAWVQIGRLYGHALANSPSFAGLNLRYD